MIHILRLIVIYDKVYKLSHNHHNILHADSDFHNFFVYRYEMFGFQCYMTYHSVSIWGKVTKYKHLNIDVGV